MKFLVLGCAAVVSFLVAADIPSDSEAWNEGVGYYRTGDLTNALRVLKPLMLSPTHGPRAAEVVAKLSYDQDNLELAAAAAQIALRAAPDDAKANRNFTRATDRLPALRKEARLKRILSSAQGQDPGAMLLAGAHEARALLAESGTYRTNAAPKVVALADRLAARAAKLEETWLVAKEAVCQSVTNEQQAATIVEQVDAAAAKTRQAAEQLGDLDPEGYASVSAIEEDFTRFAKQTAAPPASLAEDLTAQTNAWIDAETVNGRDWQKDALDWTRAFRARFPAWARAYEQQAQSDTNKPPFTAEDQAKISALATELEKLQIACSEKVLPPEQEKSLQIIHEIQDLMPKDKNQNQQNQSNQSNPQNQDQDSNRQNKQDDQQNPNQDQDQDKDQNEPQDRQEQDPNEQSSQADEDESKADETEQPEDREVEDILKKAQERSDEHEADKKARMRKAPLPPNERDW